VLRYDGNTRFPGLYAAVPCASTALLLATAGSSSSRVGRWLSAGPLVFTGLISYSLYLWHLPVLAFAGYYLIRPLEPWHLAVLLPSIYALSAASWRYVEMPIRRRKVLGADSRFLPAAGGATLALVLLGAILYRSDGLPARLDEAEVQLIGAPNRLQLDAARCITEQLSVIRAGSLCRYGPTTGAAAKVLVWGDSHAIALMPAYEHIAQARGVSVHMAVRSACRPLLDSASETEMPAHRRACGDFNHAVIGAIDELDPDLVILNAFWTIPDLSMVATAGAELADDRPSFEQAVERTLRATGDGRKVCVVGGVPTLRYVMPYAYIMARKRGIDPDFIALRSSDAAVQHRDLDRYFTNLSERHGFTFVDPKATLCAGATCELVTPDGRAVYRDNNHLSVVGADLMIPALDACFDGMG
jgi:hypothetical protein